MGRALFLGRFEIDRTLGQGSYGKVKLAVNVNTGQKVALKIIEKASLVKEEDIMRIKNEVRVLHLVRHPNIVRVFEVLESQTNIVFESEYIVGGELFNLILRTGPLEENLARNFFRQMVSAVAYLHSHFIVHRDIKPENILLTQQGQIRIIDFGFARFFDHKDSCITSCGSLKYCAPEVLRHEPYQGPEVDIWCLGVTLYAMLNASLPFNSKTNNEAEIIQKICNSHPHPGRRLDKDSLDLILLMLRKNRQERPKINQVASHPWVTRNVVYTFPPIPVVPCGIHNPDPVIMEQFPLFGLNVDEACLAALAGTQVEPVHAIYALLKTRLDRGEAVFSSESDVPDKTVSSSTGNLSDSENSKRASETSINDTTCAQETEKVTISSTTTTSDPSKNVKDLPPPLKINKPSNNTSMDMGSNETCIDSAYDSRFHTPISPVYADSVVINIPT